LAAPTEAGLIRKTIALVLSAALWMPAASAQQPLDAQVAKGIEQVERGDTAGAILTLDAAARRLAAVSRPYDLARAYLYLAVAYVAEGQETLAKARFRDALRQEQGLSLDPNRYSPRAVELLEEAKRAAAIGGKPHTAPSCRESCSPARRSRARRCCSAEAEAKSWRTSRASTGRIRT
jgi:tetratricopeptide (TPR) repeat protein